jgi:hypothetical protein
MYHATQKSGSARNGNDHHVKLQKNPLSQPLPDKLILEKQQTQKGSLQNIAEYVNENLNVNIKAFPNAARNLAGQNSQMNA